MRYLVLLLLALAALLASATAAPGGVAVERVLVHAARRLPGGRALVQLRVVLRNRSADATYDGYGFQVTADGKELAAFHRTLFFGHPTAPGQEDTVRLYNFWAQGAGAHTVAVTVTEARQVQHNGHTTRVVGRSEASDTRSQAFKI